MRGCGGRTLSPGCPTAPGGAGHHSDICQLLWAPQPGWGQRSLCRNFSCLQMENSLLCTHANEGWGSCAHAPATALPSPCPSQAGRFHAAPTKVTITHPGPPNLSFPLEMSWSQGTAVSPGQLSLPTACLCTWGGLCPCPAIQTPVPLDPCSGAREAFAEATHIQPGPYWGPGSRGVPRSRSHPHCWAQVGEKGYARVLGGRRSWEETDICPCSAL